jgi:hypothetical protein
MAMLRGHAVNWPVYLPFGSNRPIALAFDVPAHLIPDKGQKQDWRSPARTFPAAFEETQPLPVGQHRSGTRAKHQQVTEIGG